MQYDFFEITSLELFMEATGVSSHIILDKIYPSVEAVLSTPYGDRQFKAIVGAFIDKNNEKLHTSGPMYNIPFTELEKEKYFSLFKLKKDDVKSITKEVLKAINDKGNFRIISDQPIFSVLFCCNRYYAIKKDEKSENLSLAALALSMYPMMFSKYFKYGVNTNVMQYTMDNLSEKFIIKKVGHLFGMWMHTITQCFTFHKSHIIEGTDVAFVNYIMRVRNAYNSAMKKIAVEFFKNHKEGNAVYTATDTYDDNAVIDIENDSNRVEAATDKIMQNLITTGLDLRLAEAAARSSMVSISDLRNYLNIILTEQDSKDIRALIESIIFLFIYESHRSIRDINSKIFLEYALALYKKTNSQNKNIINIKSILDKWAEVVGLTKSFSRPGTLTNYKRAMYVFFVLSIQKYN